MLNRDICREALVWNICKNIFWQTEAQDSLDNQCSSKMIHTKFELFLGPNYFSNAHRCMISRFVALKWQRFIFSSRSDPLLFEQCKCYIKVSILRIFKKSFLYPTLSLDWNCVVVKKGFSYVIFLVDIFKYKSQITFLILDWGFQILDFPVLLKIGPLHYFCVPTFISEGIMTILQTVTIFPITYFSIW